MGDATDERVFERITALRGDLLDAVRHLVAIPSVAGDIDASRDAARATAELCRASGLSAEVWRGSGAPVVFAEMPAPEDAPTVLLYGHYDVQPPDPLDAWDSPPFAPEIRDGAMFGRGSGDNKGQFAAHLFGLRALNETAGCPIGVKVLIEGEEEMGSPTLAEVVEQHREQLACDLVLTADGPYQTGNQPLIILGVRGLLYVDVGAAGAERDLHSGSHGGTAPTPARSLVQALADLWDERGRVAVPGFYDRVRVPAREELELASLLAGSDSSTSSTAAHWRRLMFEPNLNIAGLTAGYGGPGVKTIVPHRADAKLDVRLVADQDPEEILALLRGFLAERGIDVHRRAAVPPSRTPADSPFIEPIRDAVTAAWGRAPLTQPSLGGTTPDYVFTQRLGVPSVLVPYGPPDMHHHAPNERMEIEAMLRGARTTVAICRRLAVR